MKNNYTSKESITNLYVLEKLYNVTILEEVDIFVPNVQHNKRCGNKRLVGEIEKSIMKAQKKPKNAQYLVKKNHTTAILVQVNLMLRNDV